MRGLLLVVNNPNNANWTLRYEIRGAEHYLGLGSAREVELKMARERARAARLQLLDGIDPLEAKRADRAAKVLASAKSMTFAEAAAKYLAQHEKGWRNRRQAPQFLSSMKAYAFPKLGALPVSAIDVGLVLEVLEPHWQTKTETMSRVRRRIEAVLDWCAVRGYRTGDNPARWRGHLQEVLPARSKIAKTEHHAALPFAELPEFLVALRDREGVAARALEFLILCAARTGEVVGARWSELDLKAVVWTLPAGRMKGGKEHRVPLPGPAVENPAGATTRARKPSRFYWHAERRGV